jgi:hypothetical protein
MRMLSECRWLSVNSFVYFVYFVVNSDRLWPSYSGSLSASLKNGTFWH